METTNKDLGKAFGHGAVIGAVVGLVIATLAVLFGGCMNWYHYSGTGNEPTLYEAALPTKNELTGFGDKLILKTLDVRNPSGDSWHALVWCKYEPEYWSVILVPHSFANRLVSAPQRDAHVNTCVFLSKEKIER